ncbi:hypothetical protein CCR75_001457 [Bremia lactucae]|uniref:Peptidase C1A papain C-terminal domain-containing protein n=1 Tax=Bremia lactucae TaxID=4779 RepID=A0A976ILY0_BRELC|nr:hypothetical protein CCR75_001457 [Bremia lactucae]
MRRLRLILLIYALKAAAATSVRTQKSYQLAMLSLKTRTQQLGPPRTSDKTRAEALAETTRVVDKANAAHAAGKTKYFMTYNELSDLTDEQYQGFLTSKPDQESPRRKQKHTTLWTQGIHRKKISRSFDLDSQDRIKDEVKVPIALDWTTKDGGKYMTPIKNQGTCGSCWAFAGVAAVESRYAIENQVRASALSVEQVLSCSGALDHIQSKYDDNMTSSSDGCLGGMAFLTYAFMERVKPHGIACERDYSYAMATNESNLQCLAVFGAKVVVSWTANVSDYQVVASNENALLQAVTHGPVTATLDASGKGFRHYGGGIYDAMDCVNDGNEVNHAVVIVGFGETESGDKYWILRNTWGTMWGENGYMRIARGTKVGPVGPCNLYLYADYPVNLTLGSAVTSCNVSSLKYEPLPLIQLLRLSNSQLTILVLCTLLSVIAGVSLYHGTEYIQRRKEATNNLRYQDSCDRWVLPSRDQIAAVLAQRKRRPGVQMINT